MKKLLKSQNHLMVDLLQNKLQDSGIPVIVVDKTDTAYSRLLDGFQELFVRAEDIEEATKILKEFEQNNENSNDDITD